MIRRHAFGAAVLLLAFAAWITTVVAPAAIADPTPSLLLSADGARWSETLPEPLFNPAVLWVPGDTRTSSFYVRNQGVTAAELRMQVLAGAEDDLLSTGDIVLEARVEDSPWQPVGRAGRSAALNLVTVGWSGSRRVDVRAAFLPSARSDSQAAGVALRFVVQLSEAVAARPVPGSPTLPATGAPALGLPLVLAAVCFGAAAALLRRRREA